jgi:Family of unknown function (DUF6345)
MPDTYPAPTPPQGGAVTDVTHEMDNPFAAPGTAPNGARGGAHMYGANSIETFCSAGPLSLTHDDADGWVDYVDNFEALNFRYRDAGVKIWQYYEQYDNWQDTYGADAVCAFYHSGHGGMDASGVFYVPMGAAWAGNDCTALSSQMRLGNEYERYVFWSTCLSLRVLGGHTPIRTWSAANLGLRMIFGYETVSWDNPNYGKFFWQEWNKNKSFSTAWLDASWRIAHDQAPSVAACGATEQEAKDRAFNERYFSKDRASTNWWWWRWYNASSVASREPNRTVPRDIVVPQFRPAAASLASARTLADRFGISSQNTAAARRGPGGGLMLRDGQTSVAQDSSGGISVRLGAANLDNTTSLGASRARGLAEDAVRQYGLDSDSQLVFDRTVLASAAGGTTEGSGRLEPDRVTETIVQFRQVINGVPVISPDAGTVRVSVDNDGRVTQLQSSVRQVADLGKAGRTMAPRGPEPGQSGGQANGSRSPSPEPEHESALGAAVGRQLRDLIARGVSPVAVETVPGSTEVGYAVHGNSARLVARRAIEVDFGSGYRKRYWVDAEIPG